MPQTKGAARLNPTDATLWEIQRDPALRTTIVALTILDRRPPWGELVSAVASCIAAIPKLRQRVVEGPLGLGRPHWEAFEPDLDFHLRRIGVSGSGDLRPVLDVCASLAGEGFDPDRPLWEIVLVEGWDERKAALVLKISHTLTDGLGGMNLLRSLGDDQSAPPMQVAEPSSSAGGHVLGMSSQVAASILDAAIHPARSARDAVATAGSAARLVRPSGPPLSSLTNERGLQRWVDVTEIPLRRLRASAHRGGGSINDAFLTIGLRALTEYHRSLGAVDTAFRVTMPISYRSDSDAPDGNQWTPARLVLRSDLDAHPYTDMASHRERVDRARSEPSISFSQTMAAALHELPSNLTIGIVGGMAKGSDLVMTDVPGLTEPLTIGGASVDRLYGFAPATGAALNIGLVSHLDTACIGFTIDTAAITDPDRLVACFESQAADFLRRRKAPATATATAAPSTAGRDEGEIDLHRTSALDMSFLRLETPTTPMHMGGLFVFDGQGMIGPGGEIDIDGVRSHVTSRLAAFPHLARKLKEVPLDLGRPVWVEDRAIDLTHHVRSTSIAAPGGWPELLTECETIQMELLDRDRPLFELHFLTGLDPEVFGSDPVALVEKVHHALLDGVAGIETLSMLFDLAGSQTPPATSFENRRASSAPRHTNEPSTVRLAANAIVGQLRTPGRLLTSAIGSLRDPRQLGADVAAVAGALGDLVRPTAGASLNSHDLSPERLLYPITLPLADVLDTGHHLGGTLNDVVLAAIGAGLRTLFEARGETIDQRFTALVPVSTRRSGTEADPGNHVAAMIVELPVAEVNLEAAFLQTAARVSELKRHHRADGSDLLLEAANHLPPVAIDMICRTITHQPFVNLVVTNMPGPPCRLSYRGGEVRSAVPIVPLGGNLSVSVAVLSYGDVLTIAFHADAIACPDVAVLAEATRDALAQLATIAAKSSV